MTESAHLDGKSLSEVLQRVARRHADLIAVIDRDTSLTYDQLHRAAQSSRRRLMEAAVTEGSTCAIHLRNTAEHLVTLLGALYAGLIIVPISERLTEDEIRHILTDSGATAYLRDQRANGAAHTLGVEGITELAITRDLLQEGQESNSRADVSTSCGSFLPYTSGTTGRPKGVLMSSQKRKLLIWALMKEYQFQCNDTLLNALPIAHSAGLTFTLAHLASGGRVVVHDGPFSAEGAASLIGRHAVTSVLLVPTMLESIVRSQAATSDLCQVRRWIVTGSPLAEKTRSRFTAMVPEAEIWQYYGATESPHMTVLRPHDAAIRPSSVGLPMDAVQLRICDEAGLDLEAGQSGEIFARTGWMLDGYHKNPEATEQAHCNGWYRTGDVGRIDAEGYLYITGRKRDIVISGGLNIYPAEVEAALQDHPAVDEAAVVGVADEYWGERVVAVVRSSCPVTQEQLIEHCRQRLASYKKPSQVIFVAHLPKNHMGKLDKKSVRQLVESHPQS